jgi:amidohydrolase
VSPDVPSPAGPATAAEREELVRLRRDFHRHPELMYREVRTAGIVAARLRELGYEVREGLGETGVVGDSGVGGPRLYVRADMDALPIVEENDVEYRSRNEGVMHACGHDAHTAINLMTAARWARHAEPGRLRFGFQPAEEGGRGADRMIEDGGLDGVDAALGLHVWSSLPTGKIGVVPGPTMAAVDDFRIVVEARGGHAAMPHQCDDAIVTAASIVGELQTIVSRNVDPLEAAVVTVTAIEGGDSFNVIPPRVTMRGTVRTFEAAVRELVHRRIREIVGERGTVEIESITRALHNDPAMTALVREAAVEVVGEENVVDEGRSMGGEDFSSVLATVPGCFFFVGAEPPGGGRPHHNPRFDIDEACLPLGLEVMSRAILRWLERGTP